MRYVDSIILHTVIREKITDIVKNIVVFSRSDERAKIFYGDSHYSYVSKYISTPHIHSPLESWRLTHHYFAIIFNKKAFCRSRRLGTGPITLTLTLTLPLTLTLTLRRSADAWELD